MPNVAIWLENMRALKSCCIQLTVLESDILKLDKVRGFRGDGLAVIQKATLKSDIGVLKAMGFVLGLLSNFAEIEIPASVLARLFCVTTSLEEMPSPPEKGRQARLKKNKLSDMWVF
jgi:hypothetical protein